MKNTTVVTIILIGGLLFSGCGEPKPENISFGRDVCVYCIMTIVQPQYGAVLVTDKRKSYKFDAVECMVAFYLEERIAKENLHSMWTIDFEHPGELINVEEAIYLYSDNLPSPMGLNVSAYRDRQFAQSMQEQYGGEIIEWSKVMDLVEMLWLPQWGPMYQ
jgi:copper chaperone NosL